MEKLQLFDQNHGPTHLEKCKFGVFLNRCFHDPERLVFSTKRKKSFFHDLLQRVKTGNRELQGVTRGYIRLQGVTSAYRGLQINFFLSRTFPGTFLWSIFHNNKSWINLKILTKTMDFFFSNKANFSFFINRCSKSLETLLFYPEHQHQHFFLICVW